MKNIITKRFFHRTSDFAVQRFTSTHGWYYQRQHRPITERDVDKHLNKKITLATYPIREDGTSIFLVIDIDMTKDDIPIEVAQQKAVQVVGVVHKLFGRGTFLVEDSGNRGYHVWMWFQEPIPTPRVKALGDFIAAAVESTEGIKLEVYPRQSAIFEGVGNCIKVPMGRHQKSGNSNPFVDKNFVPHGDQIGALAGVREITKTAFNDVFQQRRLEVETISEGTVTGNGLPCMTNLMREGLHTGARTVALFYLAVNLYQAGLPREYIRYILEDVNELGETSHSHTEIEKAITSAGKKTYSRFPCRRAEADAYCTKSCPFFPSKRKQRRELTISRD